MEPILAISSIHKTYRRNGQTVTALGGVSLELRPGDFIAVQGPSGSGKTTLLHTAGGLLQPEAGRVRIAGHDLYALSPERRADLRAARVGFVFQQFHLIPYLSVLDNVLAPALTGAARDAAGRARQLLERFGLQERARHLPGELSTGERQRTVLARALLLQPDLLLADEPTGNLDRENGRIVLDALAEFAGQGGAVLWVTHDDEGAGRAQRIVRLEAGRIAA